MTAVRVFETPLGRMAVAASARGVVRVALPGNSKRTTASAALPASEGSDPAADAIATHAERQLTEYLAGERRAFSVPMDLTAVPTFHRKVYAAARGIPYGRTITYGELARRVGRPRAARAVGRAMAANPLPLLVPCHRVVAADGLGGFGGGLALKRRLLTLEGAEPRPGFEPPSTARGE